MDKNTKEILMYVIIFAMVYAFFNIGSPVVLKLGETIIFIGNAGIAIILVVVVLILQKRKRTGV